MSRITQSKSEFTKVFHTVQAGFGIHLMPLFYSGSIDLVIQNLFILMLGKMMHSKQFSAKLKMLNNCFVLILLPFKRGIIVIFNKVNVHYKEMTKHEFYGRALDLISIKTLPKIQPINVWRASIHAPPEKTH